jgi:hypothetical protein
MQALEQSWREVPLLWKEENMYDSKSGLATCRLTKVEGINTKITPPDGCAAVNVEVWNNYRKLRPDHYEPEIRRLGTDGRQLGSARLVKETCDFDLIRSWLERCRKSHSDPTLKASNVPHLRVIDVEAMCVVAAPHSCRYAALSYVWGTDAVSLEAKLDNYQKLEAKRGLRMDELPRTLQDSINVVKNLGERYVWVDRLCIIQDGPYKGEQIEHMVDIYRDAVFTIIAAAGKTATASLPGVESASRETDGQLKMSIKDLNLVLSTPPLSWFLNQSKWNSRAWTYQEWQFSKRALIFSPQEAFFVCVCGTKCESLVSELECDSERRQDTKVLGQLSLVTDRPEVEIPRHTVASKTLGREHVTDWLHFIENYSKREMTYGSDVLNALRSTVVDFSRTAGIGVLAGVPETDLHVALMWRPEVSLQRRWDTSTDRKLFPTWSWCGWIGQIEFELREFTPETIARLRHDFFFMGHNDNLRFIDSGTWRGVAQEGQERDQNEIDDDMERLESEFGVRLSIEAYGGHNAITRYERFRQEEIKYNKLMNLIAISTVETMTGQKPTSKAQVALARKLMAFENLDGALATEHYMYLDGHYSGEHTPVLMIRNLQELCSRKISSLQSQLSSAQSEPLPVPPESTSMMAETGFLIFKTLSACFSVCTNLAHESVYDRAIYPYGVYNWRGDRVGEVVLNSNDQPPPREAEFIVLCKQHPETQLRFAPQRPGEQPGEHWAIINDVKYGVLMIERRNGLAYRLGQGTISVPRWDMETQVEKLIVLA